MECSLQSVFPILFSPTKRDRREQDGIADLPAEEEEGKRDSSYLSYLHTHRVFLHGKVNLDMDQMWDTFYNVRGPGLMVKPKG